MVRRKTIKKEIEPENKEDVISIKLHNGGKIVDAPKVEKRDVGVAKLAKGPNATVNKKHNESINALHNQNINQNIN